MRKDKRFRLVLSIDSPDIKELSYALTQVAKGVSRNGNEGRFNINSTTVEFELSKYFEIDYRIERINGNLCYIFKSRMNDEQQPEQPGI